MDDQWRQKKEHGYLGNQRGRDLIKSINSLKRDFPPLVMVLMAFQTGGICFVLSIADWSPAWWDFFDVKNKGFLLGYTDQDWWCMKSRPKRVQTEEDTPIFPREDHRFSKSCLYAKSFWKAVYVYKGWRAITWKWTSRQDWRFMVFCKARTKVDVPFPTLK